MDKRTVIAFVLIGLIVILMPYYMQWAIGDKPHIPPQTQTTDVSRETSPGSESLLAESPNQPLNLTEKFPVPEGKEIPQTAFEPQNIVIDTDVYQATISTQGGVITSWKLKAYFDRFGNWLELMKPNDFGLGLNIGDQSLDQIEFKTNRDRIELSGDQQDVLVLIAETNLGKIEKHLHLHGNRYRIELDLNGESLSRSDRLTLRWNGAISNTEGNPQSSGFYDENYDQVVTHAGGEMETWNVDRIKEGSAQPSGQISWVGIRNKYFLAALIPNEGRFDLELQGDVETNALGHALYDFHVALKPEETGALKVAVFLGPISYDVLREQNRDFSGVQRELNLDEFMDYGPSFLRSILKPVTIMIMQAFLAIHHIVPNYGLVIILFSLLVKIVVFPLTHKSLESAAKMQQLQPKMVEIRERYGNDSQKMNQAMMKLYKDEKINPLGGCLPMLLQMPILFSLFSVFRGTIEFRQAGFIAWITDLSKPDTIPIGSVDLHVLPLLMGISMFIQQKMTMKDPKQAALVYIMPVFLTYIFWTMSSGLVFYYTLYNVLTLAQQYIMEQTKKITGST